MHFVNRGRRTFVLGKRCSSCKRPRSIDCAALEQRLARRQHNGPGPIRWCQILFAPAKILLSKRPYVYRRDVILCADRDCRTCRTETDELSLNPREHIEMLRETHRSPYYYSCVFYTFAMYWEKPLRGDLCRVFF